MPRQFKNIGTKVSPEAYEILSSICAKKQISLYDLLQMLCDVIVRYTSDSQNLQPDMEEAIMLFEHMDNWKRAYNLCDYTADKQVTEATYFVGDPKKEGTRAIHVKAPFFGDWTQDTNVSSIFERTCCLMMPTRYKRMRMLAQEHGCHSLIEMIDSMIGEQEKEDSLRDIRSEFEDARRSNFGKKADEDVRYKRVMHRTVDSLNAQLDRTRESDGEEDEDDA